MIALSAPQTLPDLRSRTLAGFLVALCVVMTAFNDIPAMLPAGELSSDAFVYVFPLLTLCLLWHPGRVEVPTFFTIFAIALVGTILAGIWANIDTIATADFKGRSGKGRVITQSMSVGFGLMVMLVFYNAIIRGYVGALTKGAFIAVLVMAGFGVLEMSYWYGIPGLAQVHEALSGFFHATSGLFYTQRLRATAFEVSWTAVMLTFLFPFAIAGTKRTRGTVLILGIVVVMTVLASSRTAMLVVGLQMMMLAFVMLRRRLDLIVHIVTAGCIALMVLFIIPGVGEKLGSDIANLIEYGSADGNIDGGGTDRENTSNITRLASIRVGMKLFHEHPILGIGLGQYGFYYPSYIDAADLRSYEVSQFLIIDPEDLWPPTYSMHVRLLAETGIVGYAIWLGTILILLLRALRRASASTRIGRIYLASAMTLLGWLLLGVSIDSFRFFGGWIAIAVVLALPRIERRLR